MLLLRIAMVAAALGLWWYAIYDVIRTPSDEVRILPKLVWLLIVIATSLLGSVLWLMLGRPEREWSIFARRAPGPMRPPDDSPEYLARLDEEIRRRRKVEELRRSQELDPDLQRSLDEEIQRLEDELRREGEDES